MFGRFMKSEESVLDAPIVRVLEEMSEYAPDDEKYPELLAYLEKLHNLRELNRPVRVSKDTMAIVAGNLLGILLIVSYEHTHVMVSKGLNFLLKPKQP